MDFNQAARQLGLGSPQITPYRPGVGGVAIRPYRVGAPAVNVPPGGAPPVEYADETYTGGGNSYFGLGIEPIGAGVVAFPVQRNPIRGFQPLELRCPSTTIGLLVDQVTMQGMQFFANKPGQGVPIEIFSEVSRIQGFEMKTIQPETGVQFNISNPTAGILNFSGCFRGTQVW